MAEKSHELTCVEREAQDFPALERIATTTVGGEPQKLTHAGACEETGKPRATVQATMSQWDSRAVGVQFLKQHGWHSYRGGLLLSDDRKFAAESSEFTAADAETGVVILTFTRFVGP